MAGLDFFDQVVHLQRQYARTQTVIGNSLQTNGTLITKEWAAFFKKNEFLIGVSLDGTQQIHDSRRVYSNGTGSFNQVMRGIQHEQQVEFNILTVVHEGNVDKAAEMLNFYAEHGFNYIQFIPCMDFRAQQPDKPPQFLITSKQYGQFLCDVFDIWFNDGNPVISERFFDNLFRLHVGYPAESCIHRDSCPKTLILEQNGDAYPCDFFMNSNYKLGNVGTDSLDDILSNPQYDQFLRLKPTLPDSCQSCQYLKFCHGGCPRNRRWSAGDGGVLPDVFCESYKMIYQYSYERMEQIAVKWRKERTEEWIARGRKLPGRNDLCLCGSGRKYKKCCEDIVAH
ncbi:SPASM domain-containing protein [Paenibacillus sp. FSL K6-2524]|uniref:SPASM domain-containing protein n=1 Tax=Paenibacillus sp. FSL K6-2524 TaxID=2954516 RepID=UPI0030FA52CE